MSIKQNFKKLFKDKFNILYWIQSLKMGLDFLFLMLPAGVSYVKTAQEAQTRGVIWAFTGVTELSRMFFGKQWRSTFVIWDFIEESTWEITMNWATDSKND